MEIIISNESELKTLDTARILKEAESSLRSYQEIEIAYHKYLMTFETMHHYHEKIIEESPYEDTYDFLHDYQRYKMGLPIYIHIVRKEE